VERNSAITIFTQLYNEYSERYIAVACSYLHDKSLSSDVVAEVFMDLWKRWDEITVKESDLPRYLMGAVKFKCIDANRSAKASNTAFSQMKMTAIMQADLRVLQNDSITSAVFSGEIRRNLFKVLNTLPPRTRAVFMRSRFSDQSYAEIAKEMNISVRNVTSDIQKALSALREGLKDFT